MPLEEQRTLLAVFAHPDDESFGIGGTLARYAAEGVRVVLACATLGEAGEIHDPNLGTREQLAEIREGELRCACDVLGISLRAFQCHRSQFTGNGPFGLLPLEVRWEFMSMECFSLTGSRLEVGQEPETDLFASVWT